MDSLLLAKVTQGLALKQEEPSGHFTNRALYSTLFCSMLNVNQEDFARAMAEERQYKALLAEKQRHRLQVGLTFRTLSLACLIPLASLLAIIPSLRFLIAVGIGLIPLFFYHLFCTITRKRWIEKRLQRQSERQQLKALAERAEIRSNVLMQKQAQDEIERLKAEIEAMKRGDRV